MAKRSENAAHPLGEVVQLEAFSTPEKTQHSRRQRYLRAAKTWLTGKRAAERQAIEEEKLRKLPEVRLAHLVPPIDWSRAARALDAVITAEYASEPVVFFITPPFGGHGDVAAHWARLHAIDTCAAPSIEALLDGDSSWMAQFDGKSRWVLPALQHCFLRTSQGIQGVRALLESALAGQLGRGVIGCDSWSYAYLKHVVGLDSVPALTLQAVEGEQLAEYFLGEGQNALTVYSTRTGKPVSNQRRDKRSAKSKSELQYLAAYCRGHLGVAWYYWRERLREPVSSTGDDNELWLIDALDEAELTNDTGDVAILVLHALLIHGGLNDAALAAVLPFSYHETLNARLTLTRLKVLGEHQGRWQVAPLSYASVRELLVSRNYLVDAL
ncbi:hypothetical protein [Vreelandella sp. EE27]